MDLISPLSKDRGSANFVIVAIDHLTKWLETEPLAKIIDANTSKFLWMNIIYRFGISHSIISDNGKQFDNKKVRGLCEELGIKKCFSISYHLQVNGQVEDVKKNCQAYSKTKA